MDDKAQSCQMSGEDHYRHLPDTAQRSQMPDESQSHQMPDEDHSRQMLDEVQSRLIPVSLHLFKLFSN